MRILIISQYFYPENFKINEIAFFLKKKGYRVSVLTSKQIILKNFLKDIIFNRNQEIINE